MSIFRDRYVLKDGTVIMPENIDRVEVVGRGRSTIVSYDVERKNTYSVIAEEGMFRTDRPTGMVDSTGKVIFERDIVCSTDGDRGTVAMWHGRWIVRFHTPNLENIPLYEIDKFLTITGMVPWEDGR